MKKYIRRFFFIILTCIPLTLQGAQDIPRTALVMGNWGYEKMSALTNIKNDAGDMVLALRAAGFQVVFIMNGGVREMNAKIREFGELLKTRQGIGLVYYSGHGIQSEGINYLVPVDAAARTQDSLKYETIPVDQVLAELTKANNNFNIIILDACRYDPYTKGLEVVESPGLAKMDAPQGSIIAFAINPGNTSSTNPEGRNSLYTKYLLQAIKTPGLSVEDVFKKTLQGVNTESKGKQILWMSTSFVGDFYFLGGPSPVQPQIPVDESLWQLISDSTVPDLYGEFLKKFPNSPHAGEAKAKLTSLENTSSKPVNTRSLADIYNQALDLNATDQRAAAALYLQAAQKGYARAQVKVGTLYRTGKVFGQNYEEALKWYKKGADQGDEYGLHFLGFMYDHGLGVLKDGAKAVSLYQQAAEKGEPYSQEALGDHYLSGFSVGRDLVLSTKYYKLAAEQGLEDSQFQLCLAYFNGRGVGKDKHLAFQWCRKSADQDNPDAQEALAEFYDFGEGIDQDLTQAVFWYEKALEHNPTFNNYAAAALNLGTLYTKNNSTKQDSQKALNLFQKAGEAGDPMGWMKIGILYEDGAPGVPKNYAKAREFYEKAGKGGYLSGWYRLGVLYQDGGVDFPKNITKAIEYYKKSEENPNSAYNLGVIYFQGVDVPEDLPQAFKWFLQAAHQGDKSAAKRLSAFYKNGWGTSVDTVQAEYWAEQSEK